MNSMLYLLIISQTLQLVDYKAEQHQRVRLAFHQSIILICIIILAVIDFKYRRI